MKALPLLLCAVTVLAGALPVAAPVEAGTGIQRCVADDGSVMYTDRACGLLEARNAPMSADLATRIVREELRTGAERTLPGNEIRPMLAAARRSPTSGCARTPTQLAMDLSGSMALADVNRLAESYHWVGQTHEQAQALMHRLERMSREPLADVQYFDATLGLDTTVADASADADMPAGIMQLTLGDSARQVVDMNVHRYAGCYFVTF